MKAVKVAVIDEGIDSESSVCSSDDTSIVGRGRNGGGGRSMLTGRGWLVGRGDAWLLVLMLGEVQAEAEGVQEEVQRSMKQFINGF